MSGFSILQACNLLHVHVISQRSTTPLQLCCLGMTSDSEVNHSLFLALCKSLCGRSCPRPQLLLGHHLTTTQAASKSAAASCSCHDHTAAATEKCGSGHCLGHGSIFTLLHLLYFVCNFVEASGGVRLVRSPIRGRFLRSEHFMICRKVEITGNILAHPRARCRFGPTPNNGLLLLQNQMLCSDVCILYVRKQVLCFGSSYAVSSHTHCSTSQARLRGFDGPGCAAALHWQFQRRGPTSVTETLSSWRLPPLRQHCQRLPRRGSRPQAR